MGSEMCIRDRTEDDYFDQLQSLMLELATVQRSIDEPASEPESAPEQLTPVTTPGGAEPLNPDALLTNDEVTPVVD